MILYKVKMDKWWSLWLFNDQIRVSWNRPCASQTSKLTIGRFQITVW